MPCENRARKRGNATVLHHNGAVFDGTPHNAQERARRRFLRDVSVLILGRDWEAQPLPGARARAGAARDRRRDAWAAKAIRGNLMKKVYTIFIKREERYDRSGGNR